MKCKKIAFAELFIVCVEKEIGVARAYTRDTSEKNIFAIKFDCFFEMSKYFELRLPKQQFDVTFFVIWVDQNWMIRNIGQTQNGNGNGNDSHGNRV